MASFALTEVSVQPNGNHGLTITLEIATYGLPWAISSLSGPERTVFNLSVIALLARNAPGSRGRTSKLWTDWIEAANRELSTLTSWWLQGPLVKGSSPPA